MPVRHLTVAIFASALFSANCASSPPDNVAMNGQGFDSACTAQAAEFVALTRIERKPERYLGRCLAARAYFDGDELFSSIPDVTPNDDSVSMIGAFIDNDTFEAEHVWEGRFIGVLEDCRESEWWAVAEADEAGQVFLDLWVLGCQRGQQFHLTHLQTMNLRRVR